MSARPFGKLIGADDYAAAYVDGFGFEAVCVAARQGRNIRFLEEVAPETILEVGSGPVVLCSLPGAAQLRWRRWVIVEPARDFAGRARAVSPAGGPLDVIDGFLEERYEAIAALEPQGFDAVIVSGLVHETTQPLELLQAAVRHLRPGGWMLVSAPNALSFHRLLAAECGMIASPHDLSALDIKLGHPTVFDRQSLTRLAAEAGLIDLTFDGYLFKPFTNGQMQQIVELFGATLEEGLIELGRKFPGNAAEICVTGRKP